MEVRGRHLEAPGRQGSWPGGPQNPEFEVISEGVLGGLGALIQYTVLLILDIGCKISVYRIQDIIQDAGYRILYRIQDTFLSPQPVGP